MCQLLKNAYMHNDRNWALNEDFLILLFYIDFYLFLVQRAYFSKEISPCGDCLAIQWGAYLQL